MAGAYGGPSSRAGMGTDSASLFDVVHGTSQSRAMNAGKCK